MTWVLNKCLLLHKHAREAKLWVKVEDRAHGPRLQGPKGVSMLSHHRLSQLIDRLSSVCSAISPMGKDIV